MRQWAPLVTFVLHWGDRAHEALRQFERGQKEGLSLHTLSKMRAVNDPVYLEDLMTVMCTPKAGLGMFRACINDCMKKQWYTWHVLHPDLPVHPERSMHLLSRK